MKKKNIDVIKNPDKMISYWKNQWLIVLGIFISGIIYNGSMSLGPILQGKIIDKILEGEEKLVIVKWIGVFLAAIFIIQFMRFLKRYFVRNFANRTSATMRLMVYNNIINRSVNDLLDEKAGDLMTKVISDVNACTEGMRKFTTELFDTGVLMITYFITMMTYDVKLSLIACIFMPIAIIIAERLKTKIYQYTKSYRTQLSKIAELTNENIENELLYRVNSVTDICTKKYREELDKLEKKAVLANIFENSMQPVYKTISLIGIVAIVYVSGQRVIQGSFSVGDFSAYVAIFIALSVKTGKAAKLFNSVEKAKVSWQRIKPYLSEYVEYNKVDFTAEKEVFLRVDNMGFRAVNHCSFEIKTGEIIGVTGKVASGKSSIGIALQGIYPYKGKISLNGKELREIDPRKISKLITYVGHDSQLLSDTIYNNITLGHGGDISQVLRDVDFEKDLVTMEKGVDTVVGAKGVRLSGGQQSRLALARGLYNKSRILILDDPFAAVDVFTEKKIMDNLRNNYKECGIMLISHRVLAFDKVDKVLLVNKGETVFDSHCNLMEKSDIYREIYSLQKEVGEHGKE